MDLDASRASPGPDGMLVLTAAEKRLVHMGCFISYTVGRLLSALLCLRMPNKYLLLGLIVFENVAGASLLWFITSVQFLGIFMFLVVANFCRSFHPVLMYNILAKWMPPCDYLTTFCLITIVKELFSFFFNHLVVEMTFVQTKVFFMLFSFTYLGWCALFLVFGAESPQTSFLVSKREWNYLSRTIGPRKKIHCKAKAPWKSIFTCGILYAYVVLDFGKEAAGTTILQGVKIIAGSNDITSAFLICMQTALMVYSAGLLTSCVSMDRAIRKEKIDPGPVCKVLTTVASCGVAITMILTAYVDVKDVKITYLLLAECFFMILHTVEPAILFNLSPNYAATVYAILSCLRNVGLIGKMWFDPKVKNFDMTLKGNNVTTHIAPNLSDGLIYRYGFLIFFVNLFFIISGNIELKDFDSYDTHDWRKESVISYP